MIDERSKNAVIIAEKFANGEATIDELIAARDAAWDAARAAAWAAAGDAAWDAAWDAQRERFATMVQTAFDGVAKQETRP